MKIINATLATLLGITLSSCTPVPSQEKVELADLRTVFSPENTFILAPPRTPFITRDTSEIDTIARRATRDDDVTLMRQPRADRVSIRQVPFFLHSGDGQSYAIAQGPKALVQGDPASQCPVRTQIQVTGTGGTSQDAVRLALQRCHAELELADLSGECGCAVIAHDNVLHAPLDVLEFARALPVRVFEDGVLSSTRYSASENMISNDVREIEVLGPSGRLLTTSGPTNGEMQGTLFDGTPVTGEFEVTGFWQGRYAGVMTLETAEGRSFRLLLGQ